MIIILSAYCWRAVAEYVTRYDSCLPVCISGHTGVAVSLQGMHTDSSHFLDYVTATKAYHHPHIFKIDALAFRSALRMDCIMPLK